MPRLFGALTSFALGCSLMSGAVSPAKAYISGQSFVWGINGHLAGSGYSTASAATQLDQVKAMGMTYYRVDVNANTDGTVHDYATQFDTLYSTAATKGVKLLCMIYAPYNLSATWQTNYNTGYNTVYNFLKKYPNITVIEEGNELDASPEFLGSSSDDGASAGDYNATNVYLLGGCLTGMYNGAHAANPSARCIIDSINHPHWGWFQALQNNSVPWDITGVHWYSSSGSILGTGGANGLDKYSAFGKKIWVTEVNNGGGSAGSNAAEVSGMQAMVNDMYYHNNVEAIIAYGLYDDASGAYGFYSTPSTAKPIVSAFTSWISSPTGPCSLPIGHRIALTAYTGYYVTEQSGDNTYLQANSATTLGKPQYFDVVDSLWPGYSLGQIALWCENTNHYVSDDWQLTGNMAHTMICNWQTGIGNGESFNVTNIGGGYSALQNVLSGYYVTCNLAVSDYLQAQYATTPSGWEYFHLTDLGIAPYNPYNSNSYLGANQKLTSGQTLISPNGHAKLQMGSNGNLVLYNTQTTPNATAWSTSTSGNTGAYMLMQADGNLVVYKSNGTPLWASATYGHNNSYLGLTNTGNLAVYSQSGTLLWQTNTAF